MTWVYMALAVGSAGFLVWIVIEYLKGAASLKPKADIARREIKEIEIKIESEQVAVDSTNQEVEALKSEVAEIEKALKAGAGVIAKHQENERRRNPTKFRVED